MSSSVSSDVCSLMNWANCSNSFPIPPLFCKASWVSTSLAGDAILSCCFLLDIINAVAGSRLLAGDGRSVRPMGCYDSHGKFFQVILGQKKSVFTIQIHQSTTTSWHGYCFVNFWAKKIAKLHLTHLYLDSNLFFKPKIPRIILLSRQKWVQSCWFESSRKSLRRKRSSGTAALWNPQSFAWVSFLPCSER